MRKLSREDLLDSLAAVNAEVEGRASTFEYQVHGEYSYRSVLRHFGGWEDAHAALQERDS